MTIRVPSSGNPYVNTGSAYELARSITHGHTAVSIKTKQHLRKCQNVKNVDNNRQSSKNALFIVFYIFNNVTFSEVMLCFKLLKAWCFLYVPPGLTSKNSTLYSLSVECFVWISEQTAFAVYVINP